MLSHIKSHMIPGVWNNPTERLFADGIGCEYVNNHDNQFYRNEILKYQDASIETAKGLAAFGTQCTCGKITLIKSSLCSPTKWQIAELKSATIPVTWNPRTGMMSVFELLATLQNKYDLQKNILKKLQRENNFLDPVDEKESIRISLRIQIF
ncbi:hypothetical protein CU097_008155 [Rhizopus azygosporus]|uniref:Uncharacterized protein n=1 Tax=Rhizopus azygosporus TaxID=86630 RepID=A0A367JMR7_RHIAZ|nr:hypothetical protein CU097_008155 [Rhizopus azygosporus]